MISRADWVWASQTFSRVGQFLSNPMHVLHPGDEKFRDFW